jgi:hypothetical protein
MTFAAEPFEGFLQKHCVGCHGPKKSKGDLRLDQLSRDFKSGIDGQVWAEVVEKINAGEMPPEDEPQPTAEEIGKVIAELDTRIREGRAARMAARPPVAHYRLSRKEYQNTVYDLLGVRYDPTKPGELNEDTLWHGYERIGSQLSLSPSHVDRYYRAAEIVLDRAFPAKAVEARKIRQTAAELRYGGGEKQKEALEMRGRARFQRPGNSGPRVKARVRAESRFVHSRAKGCPRSTRPVWLGHSGRRADRRQCFDIPCD